MAWLQENHETVPFHSQERDECISRMTEGPITWKAIVRLRKMIEICSLDQTTWGYGDHSGETLVEWLGQKPGWSVLDCLLGSKKVQGVIVDISFEKKFG